MNAQETEIELLRRERIYEANPCLRARLEPPHCWEWTLPLFVRHFERAVEQEFFSPDTTGPDYLPLLLKQTLAAIHIDETNPDAEPEPPQIDAPDPLPAAPRPATRIPGQRQRIRPTGKQSIVRRAGRLFEPLAHRTLHRAPTFRSRQKNLAQLRQSPWLIRGRQEV